MKKARYAFAALGAAPALGMMAPTAAAAPASSHAQAGPAKTVRLSQDATPALSASTSSPAPAPSPQFTCHPGTVSGGWSKNHLYLFRILHYGHCVNGESGLLTAGEPGLSERIRAYSQHGRLVFWSRFPEKVLSRNHAVFPKSGFSSLNWNPVYEICGALVPRGTNTVDFGPVCLFP